MSSGAYGMSDIELAIAAVFKAKGLSSIGEKDFVMFVSMDRRWFTPAEAQRLLEAGLSAKMLAREGHNLVPTFDPSKVTVPSGFIPDKKALAQGEPEAIFPAIVRRICDATRLSRREVISLINRKQDEAGVEIEVASMLVAAEKGVDVKGFIEPARKEMMERYAGS